MASQNPEIAEALAFFRAKKCAYASPMDVARALGEGSTAIHVVDVRNPVAPIPTIIKGAVWIPEHRAGVLGRMVQSRNIGGYTASGKWLRGERT